MAAAVPTDVTLGGTNVTAEGGSYVTVDHGAKGAATVTAAASGLRATASFAIPEHSAEFVAIADARGEQPLHRVLGRSPQPAPPRCAIGAAGEFE